MNDPDQRSVKDLLFESFSRPIMAKSLQNGLRAAAYDVDPECQQIVEKLNSKFPYFSLIFG